MDYNLIQTKNILNNTKSILDTRIPRYSNLFSETNYSNFRHERDSYLNSMNNYNINNISTSLSSFDKYNLNNNTNSYYNNPFRSSKSRSRSRSPCFCGCHGHEECINLNDCVFPREKLLQKYNDSLANMNQEMNKKNDNLINEIIYLKKNLDKIETELNRTKNEKDACSSYIKELEKELSKSNMNNEIPSSKRRAMNYSKMRDYEKYHDMLNKSFEVLDSVSNQCTNPKGKTKGGVNYYFNRDKDYDSVIKTQKNWINNLPMSLEQDYNNINYDNENENEPNETDIYKYPEGYTNTRNMSNSINKSPYDINRNSTNNLIPKKYYNTQKIPNFYKTNSSSSSYPKKKTSNNLNRSSSNPKKRDSPYQNNFFDKHIMYKTNNRKNTPKSLYYKNNSEANIPKKNSTYEYIPNLNNQKNNIPSKERYLVMDKFGNPIFIQGKRLLAMELVPYLDNEGKEQIDDNGNILFIGPDGNPKTQDDLQPIILDNEKPLVNEENKPFLGVDNVIMVNRFGNPILGPGELYDINNKVVKGELGILPKTNKGNLIKMNVNNEPLNQNNENPNNDNNDINNNLNYKSPKPLLNKTNTNKNIVNDLNNNTKKNPLNIKPLLGSDGKPILDKNNNPILLDENGNVVQDPNIQLLIDQSGFPVYNTLGQAILLDKDKNPLNGDENINQIPDNKNIIKNYNDKIPEIKDKKKKIKSGKYRKKKKKNNLNNDNNETRKFHSKSIKYPKPNPSFQRKLNILPERSNRFNPNEYLSTCFACDLGCSVSRSGYSPMTYSPYNKKNKRRDITPYK